MIKASDYLQSFRIAEQRIQLKILQVQRLREQLVSFSPLMDKEQVSHTKKVGVMAETVAAIIDLEKEIDHQMSELLKKKGEAYHLLDQIKPENAKVLLEHFFSGKTVDALSHEIHVCKRHAQRRLNDAILEFQAVLNTPIGITNLLTTRMSLQSDDGSLR